MKALSNILQKEQSRRILISAGKRILQSKSVNLVKILDVVMESGLARGSFYNHFQDKESFMAVLTNEITLPFRSSVADARKLATDSVNYPRITYHALVNLVRADPAVARILATNRHEFSKYFFTPAIYDPIQEEVIEDIVRGCKTGLFHRKMLGCIEPFSEFVILLAVDIVFKAAVHPHDTDFIDEEIEFASKLLGEFDAPDPKTEKTTTDGCEQLGA